MPEGPSIVILKELAAPFIRKKVIAVSGNANIEKDRATGQTVIAFKSWGKHFLICFKDFTIKIHLMLFGSYRINEEREMTPRLSLKFKTGTLNFYACSVKILEGDLNKIYDWTADVMSDEWDAEAANRKLRKRPKMLACDALLDQDIFAGSGNIIKNEVLFRLKIHPQSTIGALPTGKLKEMTQEVRNYSFDFLQWKKAYVLKKHWLVHTKRTCPQCKNPLTKAKLGIYNRRTFFCSQCQILYK